MLLLVSLLLSANQMEVIITHSAKVAGQSVGVLMKMERNFPILDNLEIQIVTSQVCHMPVIDIHTVIAFSVLTVNESSGSFMCYSP